ncbi:MAG: flagellar hook-associated protein FlgK [Planctomycetaceae bacterium]
MSFAIQVGLSALQANQQALQTVANNIANASTTGYHRQVAEFADRVPVKNGQLLLGAGVDVQRIQRVRNSMIEQSLTANTVAQGDASARLDTLKQIETLFNPSDGGLSSRLQAFFDRMLAVTSGPDNSVLRQQAVSAASDLADEINSVATSLHQQRQALDSQIAGTVDSINQLSGQITDLNHQIAIAEFKGLQPNDLRDQRDQLLNQLAEYVDVRSLEWSGQPNAASFAQGAVLLTQTPPTLTVKSVNGQLTIWSDQGDRQVSFGGGKLAGLLAARNQIIPATLNKLQALADTLVRSADQIQATGLGQQGPLTWLDGTRGVTDVTAPLANADTRFPITAGKLYISVMDKATGARQMTAIDIDPATDSLTDVAAKIDAINHLQTYVNPQTKTLSIGAEDGYAFDFVGRLETAPDLSAVTGTSRVALSGRYTASTTDAFTFKVVGSGAVGAASGLQVEVRNSAGTLLKTLDVGTGYEPGKALDVADGVQVSFGAGTLNAGDTFTTDVVANSDTSGVLPALGLNTFFDGTNVGGLSVRDSLLSNPDALSVSQTGLPGEGNNAARFADLRDQLLMSGGKLTFEDYLAETTGLIGSDVQTTDNDLTHLKSLGDELNSAQQSESGVDPNEEMVKLLQYQKAFQSAAKLITTVNQTLDELMNIIQ